MNAMYILFFFLLIPIGVRGKDNEDIFELRYINDIISNFSSSIMYELYRLEALTNNSNIKTYNDCKIDNDVRYGAMQAVVGVSILFSLVPIICFACVLHKNNDNNVMIFWCVAGIFGWIIHAFATLTWIPHYYTYSYGMQVGSIAPSYFLAQGVITIIIEFFSSCFIFLSHDLYSKKADNEHVDPSGGGPFLTASISTLVAYIAIPMSTCDQPMVQTLISIAMGLHGTTIGAAFAMSFPAK